MAFCVIEAPGQTCKKRFWQGEVSLMVTAFITDAVYSSSNAGMLKLCHQCGSQVTDMFSSRQNVISLF